MPGRGCEGTGNQLPRGDMLSPRRRTGTSGITGAGADWCSTSPHPADNCIPSAGYSHRRRIRDDVKWRAATRRAGSRVPATSGFPRAGAGIIPCRRCPGQAAPRPVRYTLRSGWQRPRGQWPSRPASSRCAAGQASAARPRQPGTSFESRSHSRGRQAVREPSPPGPLNAMSPAPYHPGRAATSTHNWAVLLGQGHRGCLAPEAVVEA